MAYIETALVSSAGKLLIQLDDGTVIDAGYVRGGAGPAGRDGQDGAPGIPGAKGDPGENGAKWHTGVGAPEIGLGDNGDLYMDVAASVLPIYQKVNRDWLFLCNLKVAPAGGGGGGGGAAAGDGGAIIIHPGPNPPIVDNEGKPIDIGDLWFDPENGYIWIWDGTNWVPTANKPPVIISPDPPEFNTSSDGVTEYPVMDGDLWLDPDGNILYIYRDGVWSEITGCTGGNDDGPFLKRYGDTIDDATVQVDYVWNQNTAIKSQKIMEVKGQSLYLDGSSEIQQMTVEYSLFADRAYLEAYDYVFKKFGRNINWLHLTDDTIETDISVTESSDDKSLTTKLYVDGQDEALLNGLQVLQEEIESIIPTTDKGIWQDGASATPGTGHFAMRLQGGAITQNYEDNTIDRIIISTTAKDGSAHSFLEEEVGDLIQLFDVEDKNYGLFEITAIDTTSSTEYVSFDVTWLQGLGTTNVADDVLVKTFAPPSGGTASEFLPLTGGDMTGPIKCINRPYNGIIVYGKDGPAYNNGNSIVLKAENGGTYTDPQVIIGIEPKDYNHATTKKYVDDLWDFSQYPELT